MTQRGGAGIPEPTKSNQRLAILLAMAMFVLVVDTSLMNVSISAVVRDIGTTVSGVQSAIALEALVSAAFILIGSKVGDLIGRKLAYILGLLGYAVGALAMAFAQSLTAIIVFWAVVGGLGASLLLPAMQSLIHGNFEGAAQKKAYALVGASAAIAAAVGPLLGGFVTTYLSWRVGFLFEVAVIAVVLSGIKLVHDVPYTGARQVDVVGAVLSVLAMGGIVLGILIWQEGGESVLAVLAIGAAALVALVWWLRRRHRQGKATLLDPDLFKSKVFESGVTGQMLQQIALGGTMIVLPIYLQMVLEYNALKAGLSLAPLSLTMFAVAVVAGRKAAKRRPAGLIRLGFAILTIGLVLLIPIVPRADSGWWLVVPLVIAGCGLGLLVSQLNNYTLSPISDERVSEAAGVNSAAGSFGLSFGLAFAGAIMLATLSLSFTSLATSSTVLSPAQQQQVAHALETDAQIMRFSQRLSADHLVLELHQDKRGFGDVAYRARADHDMLQDAPPLGHQREAAFALVAQGAQQRVAGFRAGIEFAAGGFSHRDMHARASALVAGIGQERQVLQVGPGLRQDQFAGRGHVVGAARQHVADPQRDAARGGQCLHVPGGLMRLAGVPGIDLFALLAGLLARAPVGGDERAVQDEVGNPLPGGPVQGLAQRRGLRGEHVDGLVLVPVGGGLGDPEAGAQAADVRPVPEPGQREDRLLPAGQGTGPGPGAELPAMLRQQARYEGRQLERDIEHDTIRQHAEPPGRYGSCGETSCTGGSALSRRSPAMSACLPI